MLTSAKTKISSGGDIAKSLLITNFFPPRAGGVEITMYKIATELPSNAVVVLTPSQSGDEAFDTKCQFKVYRQKPTAAGPLWSSIYKVFKSFLPPALARIVLYFPTALSVARLENISIIQCGEVQVGLVAYLLKKLTGIPYVVYVHGDEILPGPHWRSRYGRATVLKLVLKNSAAIFTNSEYTKRKTVQWQVDESRIVKIPRGADLKSLDSSYQTDKIVDGLALEKKKVILTVARLVEHKGHDMVIKAMPGILQQIPNAVYLIVGQGRWENQLRELVSKQNLQDHVVFAGYVPDDVLPAYYNLCDVFIMASRELSEKKHVEGFGLVYLEANGWGKPVIGGRSGGVPDAVLDGVTGLLVNPTSTSEIAEAIIKILSDQDYAQYLGANGKRRVETEMNWQQAAVKVREILTAIVEKRNKTKSCPLWFRPTMVQNLASKI